MRFFFRCSLYIAPALSLIGALALASKPVQAQVPLLSNLDSGVSNFGTVLGPAITKTLNFSVGATPVSFTSFTGIFSTNSQGTGASGVLSVALFTATAGDDPGTLVANLGSQTVSNPFTIASSVSYTFSSAAPVALAAGTRYSIVIDNVSGSDLFWYGSNPNTAPTERNGSGLNTPSYRVSSDNGATYGPSTTFNLGQVNGFVTATAPEPGTLALALGPVAFGLARVRRRSTASR